MFVSYRGARRKKLKEGPKIFSLLLSSLSSFIPFHPFYLGERCELPSGGKRWGLPKLVRAEPDRQTYVVHFELKNRASGDTKSTINHLGYLCHSWNSELDIVRK